MVFLKNQVAIVLSSIPVTIVLDLVKMAVTNNEHADILF